MSPKNPAHAKGKKITMRRSTLAFCFLALGFGGLAADAIASPMAGPAPISSQVLRARDFPGSDLGAKLAAADNALGAASGQIVIDGAGEIHTGFTLHERHGLVFQAPVVWSKTVTLAGNNEIRCMGAGVLTVVMGTYVFSDETNALLLTKGGSQISVHGCRFVAANPAVVLAGYPMSNVTMDRNVLLGLTLAATNGPGSRNLSFTNNVVEMPVQGSKNAAILLLYAKRVRGFGNHFTRTSHGIQWWGGDSGAQGSKIEQVTASGEMTFTGNICKDVAGACLWGSMGYGIHMIGNSADGCGDVCFDAEGGLDTTITGNTAKGCANGCAAMFFFGRNITITRNTFTGMSPGGGLIFLKNLSRDPARYSGIKIANNTLHCEPGPCAAAYTEAAGGIRFEANEVLNGTYRANGYGQSVSIMRNHLVFTIPLTAGGVAIGAPAVIGGTTLEINQNAIESKVTQRAGSICIAANWNDFNASDEHVISDNRCSGPHPFPIDISIVTNGANPGTRATWVVTNNLLGSNNVVHSKITGNEVYQFAACISVKCKAQESSRVQ